ncbi:hypothetical protein EXIGLDRAFT_566887, partial [Exidia glandulosa HHB12029]
LLARFSETVDAFRDILDTVDNRVRIALGRTGDWRRKYGCPTCSYKCADEAPLRFSRQLTMDGNNSHKRFISAATPDTYGLAMDKEIIRLFASEGMTQFGYDINCAHATTASRSSFGDAYKQFIHAVVGSFHGHAHGRSCQLCSHPLYILGSGREPFEG